ncbi:hypothetical protein [Myxococcus landrumensis]|uniref:Uncharacterized protein n=1 Tax=Myxococcus landrumensis TaxID=2813577 RepID=A0ABX7N5Q6_9BACT|nr:hypothetical protein [Myxococcus landrumus]QSQ14070.1 hypothetical protein JY572_38110 [Myxococcus landrumus]
MTCIKFDVPIKAPSVSNLREHWATRAKRTDAQKAATRRRCPEWQAGPLLVVRLTRVAPRALDDDNLRGALKAYRDAVAQWLRVDDRTPLVSWLYAQAKGPEPLVTVEVDWGGGELAQAAAEVRSLEQASTMDDFPGLRATALEALPIARKKLADIKALATSASYRKGVK